MRLAINVLPLREPVCSDCMKAFWANVTVGKARAKRQRPN